jgi:hypothetical protein
MLIIFLQGLRKILKILSGAACLEAENGTPRPLNIKHECKPLNYDIQWFQ